MASSSSSTPSLKYEVFLSFRGEDTRYGFVSHLLKALNQRGIVPFFDEEDVEKGQSISPKLVKAITESKIAIIIFSKNYASSTWCLDELVEIMKCRTKYNQTVIPIFYDVDPSDVRKQNNSFAESFAMHEKNFKDNMEKVDSWKFFLREAASISGYDSRNENKASCIDKIVDNIFRELPRKSYPKGLVGMDNHLKKLKSLLLLDKEPNDVRFIGIWGTGGIGKTTTARVIFNELIDTFEGGCFLQDVRKNGMKDLQEALLSKVLRSSVKIDNEFEGSDMISKRLCSKKVLLVLDDVDHETQLESLAGGREWFGKGSRIIITARDKHLLADVDDFYEIKTLSDDETIELFQLHAFKKSHKPDNFVKFFDRVISYAGGLPLSVKVLGCHLSGRQEEEWKSTLDRLKDDPDKTINAVLQVSFDGLTNIEQDIFLDIACFFRGLHKNGGIKVLDSFGFHSTVGIEVLQEKSLIHILDNKDIQMHPLFQDMCQNIVRQRADKDPGRFSRLWEPEDVIDVLTHAKGTDKVEGLVLRDAGNIKISEGAFRNMTRLRLLIVDECNIAIYPNSSSWLSSWGSSLNYLPNSLRVLHWSYYPGKSLPLNFEPRNLVSLNLSKSLTLQICPDISNMPNLEGLNFFLCQELLDVHPSVGVHNKLKYVDLGFCSMIKKFPRTLKMKSLEHLSLGGSLTLKSLPDFDRNMISLRTLCLYNMAIPKLPWSLGNLTNLRKIEFAFHNNNLRSLPNSLFGLKNLESFKLMGCSNLKNIEGFESQPSSLQRKRVEDVGISKILTLLLSIPSLRTLHMYYCKTSEFILPESNSCLDLLQELDLSSSSFVSLPDMKHISRLEVLRLNGCKYLTALPELPPRIKKLNLESCTSLKRIPNLVDLLDKYETLEFLSLVDCKQLVQKEDQFDSPQTKGLEQKVPQFLLDFLEWETAKYVLCKRQGLLQVILPGTYPFEWLHRSTERQLHITLSPSCFYNDKLHALVICANSRTPSFILHSSGGLEAIERITHFGILDAEHTIFFYIPIGIITRGIDLDEKHHCCLFEVIGDTFFSWDDCETRWGIGSIFDGEENEDDGDLISRTNLDEPPEFKVCVAPRKHI